MHKASVKLKLPKLLNHVSGSNPEVCCKPVSPATSRISERLDLWLNLYGATEKAEEDEDGLFGGSEAGSDSLLGQIEQMVRGGDEPTAGQTGKDRSALPPGGGSSLPGLM